jgi:hypothetical protein
MLPFSIGKHDFYLGNRVDSIDSGPQATVKSFSPGFDLQNDLILFSIPSNPSNHVDVEQLIAVPLAKGNGTKLQSIVSVIGVIILD